MAYDANQLMLGVVAEMQIAPPGTSTNTFTSSITNLLNSKKDTITAATQVEPCGVSDVRLDQDCTFRGNINYSPYNSCQ